MFTDPQEIGKILLLVGMFVAAVGGVILLLGRTPLFGRLPGDILVQRKSFTFYFPISTCLLVSLIMTLLLWLVSRK